MNTMKKKLLIEALSKNQDNESSQNRDRENDAEIDSDEKKE